MIHPGTVERGITVFVIKESQILPEMHLKDMYTIRKSSFLPLAVTVYCCLCAYDFVSLCHRRGKSGMQFTCCIVDEATQSQEVETLIPLMLGVKTLVLVGDSRQLPATVLSKVGKIPWNHYFICLYILKNVFGCYVLYLSTLLHLF